MNNIKVIAFCFLICNIFLQGYSQDTICSGDTVYLYIEDTYRGDIEWQRSNNGVMWIAISGCNSDTCMFIPGVTMQYRAKITEGSCNPVHTQSKIIVVEQQPTMPFAGVDQIDISGFSTTLDANTPQNGNGFWYIESGVGGNFSDSTNPNALFTGLANEWYVLSWTIYSYCDTLKDLVQIRFLGGSDFVCGDTLIDSRDGQKYPTVQIGNQCWMAKNLNVGTQIQGTMGMSNNSTIEKYCYADNSTNCDIYGGLYTWYESMNYTTSEMAQGICPAGWHIPTDEEWKEIEIALGMDSAAADLPNTWRGTDEGTQMKENGTSGYEALLSGRQVPGGSFSAIGQYEYMWSSTQAYNSSYAWRRCLRSYSTNVGRYDTFSKSYGFSVRCVKD